MIHTVFAISGDRVLQYLTAKDIVITIELLCKTWRELYSHGLSLLFFLNFLFLFVD